MQRQDNFCKKLEFGRKLENCVLNDLKKLLPDCDVFISNQEDNKSRSTYSLCDVVVRMNDHTLFGIECKFSETPYRLCEKIGLYKSEDNIPLNLSSLNKYSGSSFPFFILNVNTFAHKAIIASVEEIKEKITELHHRKPSSETILNIDGSGFRSYKGEFRIIDIMKDLIYERNIVNSSDSSLYS